MTAEAIARLRALLKTPAYVDAPLGVVDLFATDLRALLDAHDEALDALERLYDAAENGSVRGADRAAAEAVLAKAGRR